MLIALGFCDDFPEFLAGYDRQFMEPMEEQQRHTIQSPHPQNICPVTIKTNLRNSNKNWEAQRN